MANVLNLFDPTVERALPLSRGADLRFSVFDDTTDPPTPWPLGTLGIVELDLGKADVQLDDGERIIRFESELVDGRLDFLLESERTDIVPATTSSNKVAFRFRVAFAEDPTTELPVYEGPIYRGRHG